MIESQSKRTLTSFAIILIGFNSIGFAMIQNGSNFAGNPAWEFIKLFWYLEVAALAIATTVAGLSFIIFIIPKEQAASKQTACTLETQSILEISAKPAEPKQKVVSLEPPSTPPKPLKDPDPPLTKEELKRKALRQITGKEF